MSARLAQSVADHAQQRPDAAALVWDGERISYAVLQQMVDDARAELQAERLPHDRPVGIRAKKSPEAIALILACLAEGHAFLLPSVELAPETLEKLMAQAGVGRVLAPHGPRSESAASLRAIQDASSEEELPESDWPPEGPTDDITFMLTTSGSTGLPKIVPLTAGAVDRWIVWTASQFEIGPGTNVANYAPLNFDLCLVDIWTTLGSGGCVVMVDQDRATNGGYLAGLIADNEVHVLQAVPMLYRLLLDEARDSGRTFPSVRHAMTTGDKMPPGWLAQLPGLFPNARFWNLYGCTETNDSFIHEFEGLAAGNVPENVPIGKPLPGVATLIHTEDGSPLEGAGTGELLVHTPFQTRGYLHAELNEGRFVSIDGDDRIFYRGGDIVRRDEDGVVSLEGRSDFYVKVRGVRVSTQVVEQAVLAHPEVAEAVVLAVPDELAGHRLHALVRLADGSGLNSLSLRKHCATRLARTEMPSKFEIISEPLPKTSTGKVDRKACLSQLERTFANG